MSATDDVLEEFLAESEEALDSFESSMLVIEKGASDDAVNEAFRAIHTIKGAAPMFGFKKLGVLAHHGEDVLTMVREGSLKVSPQVVEVLLYLGDALRGAFKTIRATGAEAADTFDALISDLRAVADVDGAKDETPVAPKPIVAPAPPAKERDDATPQETAEPSATIRIDVAHVDALMNLAGELVLARNHIAQLATAAKSADLNRSIGRLSQLCSELQDRVTKVRMQPVRGAFSKIPRLVREVATKCGKQVDLTVTGESTELDKSVLEAIRDPLMHLVRNAIDHGIEPPAERVKSRKPVRGRLRIDARHEQGQVVIEVKDDGRGINAEKVASKALAAGLESEETLAQMSHEQRLALIFLPGFSTADRVSDVSGRGVGMDVVKTNVERIGGEVQVATQPGKGTTFRVRIPLTLAIEQAIIVREQGRRFAVPRNAVAELVRLHRDADADAIEQLQGLTMMRLRDELVPLVSLRGLLSRSSLAPDAGNMINVVVLDVGSKRVGLVVEAIEDMLEIVVKPLTRLLAHVQIFAGATVLGDGSIALILDPGAITTSVDAPSATSKKDVDAGAIGTGPRVELEQYLLFEAGGAAFAVSTRVVQRIDQVPAERVFAHHGELTVRLGDELVPTLSIGASGDAPSDRERVPIISVLRDGRHAAIIADRIRDCVAAPARDEHGDRTMLLLGERVFDVVNVGAGGSAS